jgi:mono/diheme cytochrome c family protein
MRKSMFFGAVVICLTIILGAGCGGSGGDEEPAGSVQAGEKLFKQATIGNQAGCASCHSLEAGVILVGPSLADIGSQADKRVSGLSAQEYLRQAILDPNSYTLDGFAANVMPMVWSDELTEEQVDDLIAFLLTLK